MDKEQEKIENIEKLTDEELEDVNGGDICLTPTMLGRKKVEVSISVIKD